MDNRPIGVFDSGLGGLTAVREIMQRLPDENIVYFGDTGRVPYGARSKETIIKYTRQDIRFLQQFDCKTLVIACGTASSVALDTVCEDYGIPIIGVVKATVHRACCATRNGKIGVIGTHATIQSGSYVRLIAEENAALTTFAAACPLFVPLVENGRIAPEDAILKLAVAEYLAPLRDAGVDTLILGCTHYPIIAQAIGAFMGDGVTLINPGYEAARYLSGMPEFQPCAARHGSCRFFVSDDVASFTSSASMFLGRSIEGAVELVNIESI